MDAFCARAWQIARVCKYAVFVLGCTTHSIYVYNRCMDACGRVSGLTIHLYSESERVGARQWECSHTSVCVCVCAMACTCVYAHTRTPECVWVMDVFMRVRACTRVRMCARVLVCVYVWMCGWCGWGSGGALCACVRAWV